MTRSFDLVDVFGDGAFTGNPLGVVHAADDLDTATMQRITQWLNLSETTFLLPPSDPRADYRVRIFTLERELPFAGHPTLGSCHAWLAAGGVPRDTGVVRQECGAGIVEVRRDGDRLAFAAPPLIRSGPVADDTIAEVLAYLGVAAENVVETRWIDNGPGWIGVMLKSAEAVLALAPPRAHPRRIEVGVVGPHPPGGDVDWEIRAFFSDQYGGVIEDPVTGSLNASVAQWLFESGRATGGYRAAQGTALGRRGRIEMVQEAGAIWIGGATATMFSGTCGF